MVAIASYATDEFSVAAIESPEYGSATTYCFKFYYNFHVIIRFAVRLAAY